MFVYNLVEKVSNNDQPITKSIGIFTDINVADATRLKLSKAKSEYDINYHIEIMKTDNLYVTDFTPVL